MELWALMKNTAIRCFIFCFLFMVTNFVNKYVLSVLEFKYPTIFQGWQTFVGFLVLRMAVATKHLPSMLTDKETIRQRAVRWIPGMILFVSMIYSGSKALTNTTIPVFLSLQNLVTVISCTTQMAITRKLMSLFSYLMLMLVIISSLGIINTDPQFNADGYFWMCVHVIATGAFQIYSKLTKGRLKISSHEKLYCNYIYSVIVLAPSSYLIGDALNAIQFPYLYFSKFYIGCVFSGVFGVLLSLYVIRLQEEYMDSIEFVRIQGFAKVVSSVVSLRFFEVTLTGSHAIWLAVNLLAGFVCEDPMLSSTISRVIETQPSANTNTSYSNENVSPNRKTSYSADDKTPNGMASYDIEYSSAANSKSSYNVKYSSPANSMASSFSEEYYQPRTSPGFGTKHNVLYEDFLRDDQHK